MCLFCIAEATVSKWFTRSIAVKPFSIAVILSVETLGKHSAGIVILILVGAAGAVVLQQEK